MNAADRTKIYTVGHSTHSMEKFLQLLQSIVHILSDGSTESQEKTMSRLLDLVGLPQVDMFRSHEELIEAACGMREQKIAYVDEMLAEQES